MPTWIKSRYFHVFILSLGIGLLFSALRLYKIDETFLFFGDTGRDYYILKLWQESGKPPLLGPQNSALPFNQSAIYFYILFPFYLISGNSLLSTIYANWLIHLFTFFAGVFFLRNKQKLLNMWWLVWILISIHPQYVLQHRYIWNPSFIGISLLVGFVFFERLRHKFNWKNLWGFSLAMSLATAFSYSAIPAVLSVLLLCLIFFKKKFWKFIPTMTASMALVNFPTIVFELRHKFVLTQKLLFDEKLSQSTTSLKDKIGSYDVAIFSGRDNLPGFIIMWTFIAMVAWHLYIHRKHLKQQTLLLSSLFTALLVSLLLFLAPVPIHSHYVFGVIIFGMIAIGLLDRFQQLIFLSVAIIVWLQPAFLQTHFSPAFRSIDQSRACAQQICAVYPGPNFVSVQADYHPHHNGFEFKFLLKDAGCQVFDIETAPTMANQMVVFTDNSTYNHNQTAYYELTLFGESEQIDEINCTPELNAYILQKK